MWCMSVLDFSHWICQDQIHLKPCPAYCERGSYSVFRVVRHIFYIVGFDISYCRPPKTHKEISNTNPIPVFLIWWWYRHRICDARWRKTVHWRKNIFAHIRTTPKWLEAWIIELASSAGIWDRNNIGTTSGCSPSGVSGRHLQTVPYQSSRPDCHQQLFLTPLFLITNLYLEINCMAGEQCQKSKGYTLAR